MDTVLLSSLLGFAFVTSVTPGPNNLMIMTSGASFGWRRSLRHLLGIALGFGFMIAMVTLGLGQLVAQVPELLDAIKIAGALWMLWLAFQFLKARPAGDDSAGGATRGRPLRFYEAALFQWVNPKAWTLALAVASGYVGLASSHWLRACLIALVFLIMALLCTSLWLMAGEALHRILKGPGASRIFSYLMAGLIAATAVVIVAT
jgi:threonine/homoserine/homoserine lactone efflux protein